MRSRARWIAWILLFTVAGAEAAETDSTSARRLTVIPFPFYFYSPETKSGGGVSVSVFTRDRSREENRPNSYSLLSLYTQRKQFVGAVGGEFYRAHERDRFSASISFSDFPNTFYGTGPRVDDEGEDFGARGFEFEFDASRKLENGWRLGPNFAFYHQELNDFEPDGLLAAGVLGSEGGSVSMMGFGAELDRRDNVVYARRGHFLRAELSNANAGLGSDYDFSALSLDLRRYCSGGAVVLALRALAQTSLGRPPFQALPGLGGDSLLRGYYGDRFRDRNLYALQSELRWNDWHRLGAVVFLDAGDVAHGPGEFSSGTIKSSYGFGLRILLSRAERLQIRADLGFGDDGSSGFYLSLGEAF